MKKLNRTRKVSRLIEHHGLPIVHQDPVIEVPAHRPREDGFVQVAAFLESLRDGQRGVGIAMVGAVSMCSFALPDLFLFLEFAARR